MTRQTTIPNTDPIEPHPEIRIKLHAWLDAVAAAAEARDTSKRRHDELLDAIQEAKIPYYAFDHDGRRKRVYPTVADPKLKTQNVASLEPKGRRGRARDVALPIDKAREKAVDALGTPGDRVNALDRALDAFVDAIPDGTKGTITWNGETHVIADKTPKAKTIAGPSERRDRDPSRRGRERDVAMPIDKARAKAVDALGGDVGEAVEVDAVEHRRVARSSVAAELDPFSHVRSLLDEAVAKQQEIDA